MDARAGELLNVTEIAACGLQADRFHTLLDVLRGGLRAGRAGFPTGHLTRSQPLNVDQGILRIEFQRFVAVLSDRRGSP